MKLGSEVCGLLSGDLILLSLGCRNLSLLLQTFSEGRDGSLASTSKREGLVLKCFFLIPDMLSSLRESHHRSHLKSASDNRVSAQIYLRGF